MELRITARGCRVPFPAKVGVREGEPGELVWEFSAPRGARRFVFQGSAEDIQVSVLSIASRRWKEFWGTEEG